MDGFGAQMYASIFRWCTKKNPPEVIVQEMDGEYYIRSLGMETSIRDIRLYIRLCRTRIRYLVIINLFVSVCILVLGLTTERSWIHVSCITSILCIILQYISMYMTLKRGMVMFVICLFLGILLEALNLVYWLSLIMYGIHFWIIVSNCLNLTSAYLSGISSYYAARIQTCLRFIPPEYHKRIM